MMRKTSVASCRAFRFAGVPAAIAALAGAVTSSAALAAAVSTQSGLVDGVEENGVVAFKGIPFAAPPTGALRWRAPEPPAAWSGVRKADRFSPICPQQGAYPEGSPTEPMSEDCLYLNVWASAGAGDAKLPVMVWIYGGGLINGSASTPLYAGDALARRDVVVVTANYRLGALGILAHPDLSRESARNVSGDYGLLDQIAALEWVKRNIEAFGGDPDNVTVFGQSSGAISISALIASPLARGLFGRAIGQSGGLFEPVEASPEFRLVGAEQVGLAFGEKLGAPSADALRELSVAEIVAARFNPQPNIDGYVLNETPFEAFTNGRNNDVDVMIGSNADEGLYFIADREITAANLSDVLEQDFPSIIVSLIGPKAPADDIAARKAFLAFEGDMRFGWNMRTWARLHAASGMGNTYFYRFSHTPPGDEGATHGAEMRYVFDHLDLESREWNRHDRALAEAMATYWTNFARTGNSNGDGLPEWPIYASPDESALLIGDEFRAGEIQNEASLAAIDRLYSAVRILLEYGIFIAGGLGLLLLALFWRIAVFIHRPRRKSAT